jgi:hypothetical protein
MITVSVIASLYALAVIASLVTLAQSPSLERTITISHAPKTSIIQAKASTIQAQNMVPFFLADLPPIEEKRIQFEVLRHYHI